MSRRTAKPLVRTLAFIGANQLQETDDAFDDELVEGVIGRGAMAVIYGDSNVGKTFLAYELASCVGAGQPFLGRRTAGGLAMYLATEAPASVLLRARARNRVKGASAGVAIVTDSVNLAVPCAESCSATAPTMQPRWLMKPRHLVSARIRAADTRWAGRCRPAGSTCSARQWS